MQLTRLDRYLRERFVYETHVYTLRLPESIPAGAIAEELPDSPGRKFRHRFILRNDKAVGALIESLRNGNQMFTTRVVDREAWYVPILAPQGKSVTWWLIWAAASGLGIFGLVRVAQAAWANEELRRNVAEALQLFK
ncbi:hypothetical protein OJ996_16150 [Luteolibacter sp. GHJ8]|jgi:hypothetical protein|uniref:Uncharacterized protein n=1 Tax=Luteolibacter rhizosphaerae TaxID=2989719 RepID=A0ABT3G6K6_9BACT|nr:hypothetical protein [Luteolibacter rhizosphaerae]MCW1915119.1 hypothetical protein [Luteolibacter rhizosphaerae]